MPIITQEDVLTAEQQLERARLTQANIENETLLLRKLVVSLKYELEELTKAKDFEQERLEIAKTEASEFHVKLKDLKAEVAELVKKKQDEESEINVALDRITKEKSELDVLRQQLEKEAQELNTKSIQLKEEREKQDKRVVAYNENITRIKEVIDLCHLVQE